MSDETAALFEAFAGAGVSDRMEDRAAHWIPDVDEHADWYNALQAWDKRDDEQPLAKLLQSGKVPSTEVLFMIGDLIRLRAAKPRRGPKPVPAYDRSLDMAKLEYAVHWVKKAVAGRVPVKDALDKEAACSKISRETLDFAYHGRHGGLRRARGHRPS